MTQETRNLGDLLGRRRSSGETAMVSVDRNGQCREWSCSELESGSLAYAAFLREKGIAPGSAVAILAANSVHNWMAYTGSMRAGCVCVPVNTRQPREIVEFILEDADVRFAFSDESNAAVVPEGIDHAILGDVPLIDDEPQLPDVNEKSAAEILYTSGSTGRPKGVILSHASQLSMIETIVGSTDTEVFANQRGIVVAPMFHMNALIFIASFLSSGGSLVLMSRFDAERFVQAINAHRVTVITGVPTMIALMHTAWLELGGPKLPSVNTVYIGSAPVTEAVAAQSSEMMPGANILNSYGTTETGGGIFGSHPDNIEKPATSVGYPTPQAELRLDGNGALVVRAPSMMTEYRNLPELTAAKLKDGWFNTGDMFEVDDNGFYYFTGRSDDMFVCSGENVYPGEVEKAIESHRSVLQAAVVPVPDEIRGQMPVAFVVSRDKSLGEPDIQDHVRRHVAAYLYPRRVWFVDSLPLAGTTKVDRRELMRQAEESIMRVREVA
ncbi:MAG: class I adenylate-forming enzyme family protein [Gammaproteobacteria bacterium]|nr:class I adenylate-forming enzyme family protein [Gammaproteobacteria bacterium]MCY3988383.1 class I adenylate-forming enzyme family protein [Gammaproteobacteria bacterium]